MRDQCEIDGRRRVGESCRQRSSEVDGGHLAQAAVEREEDTDSGRPVEPG